MEVPPFVLVFEVSDVMLYFLYVPMLSRTEVIVILKTLLKPILGF